LKALVQRVSRASVTTGGRVVASTGPGLLVLAGFGGSDSGDDLDWMARKLANLRIFSDSRGAMNLSILETGGSFLVVSQFTLHADTEKGRRPSFIGAAAPGAAETLYRLFVQQLTGFGLPVETGVFGADMQVELVNDGPVTLMLESPSERRS